jgi:D-alanyl-D-alanine carboxypeptidase/D-alanyl-D-alanine-endopeptidase (penicillin-binding protein 4)
MRYREEKREDVAWKGLRTLVGLMFFGSMTLVSAWGLDRAAINRALAHPNLRGASIGVEIFSITEDRVVYSRGADLALIPASNNKIITTATALHHLGAEYEFSTRIYATGPVIDGVLQGDLVLRGGGDPGFGERFYPEDPLEPLTKLAEAVAAAGIRRVLGGLLLDDSIFDRDYVAEGWPRDQLNFHYCAPVAGLSILENLVRLEVTPSGQAGRPALVRLIPRDAPFNVQGQIMTTGKKGENLIHIPRPQENGTLKVSGRTYSGNPTKAYTASVRYPVHYFGALFDAALSRAGVARARDFRLVESALAYDSEEWSLLHEHRSELLPVIIITNKESHNHFAEQLFKLAGAKVAGRGTFRTGELAARRFMQEHGIEIDEGFAMKDGSGLSRGNHVTARMLTALLGKLYGSPLRDPYIRSLPIAGMDGSLERRLEAEPYRSRVRGKTGWIREVSALSGYAQSLDGEVFAFSILFNQYKGSNAEMKGVQDAICRVMVEN